MTVEITPVRPEDIAAIARISAEANRAQVMPLLSETGWEALQSSHEERLQRLLDAELSPSLKATLDGEVVGYVAWRDGHFVTALYVSLAHQGKGIGGLLMDAMIKGALEPQIKLRASINAVEFYQRYGFVAEGPEQEFHGIRFVPMSYTLGGLD